MFSTRLKEFSQTLSLWLSLGYAAIFTGSALLLFVLIYYLLGAAIDQKDEDLVESRLREYQAVYESGGVGALKDWIDRVGEAQRQQTFFVRLVKPDQSVLFMILPADWVRADLQRIESGGQVQTVGWLRIQRDQNVDLTVASAHLPDGAFLQVGRSSDSRSELLGKFRTVFALVVGPVIVLGFLSGVWMTRRTMRPLRQIMRAVRSIIRTGRLDVRVPASKTRGELEQLVELFNRMLDGNENLIHALRGSLDNVAHDLRTPLSRLRVMLEDALRSDSDLTTSRQAIAGALEETDRVQTIIRTLMDVTLAETGMMKLDIAPTDLGPLVDDVKELYGDVAGEKEITVEKQFGAGFQAAVDPARIRQVFANLLDNALKYTPKGGRIIISARREDNRISVCFRDNGMGITEKDLPHIWDRLYRGDKSRSEHGLGLGLSLVKAIVEAHGGSVEVGSKPHEGSEFTLFLPVK
ncbi:MAG: HAMP domain-containing histidine kinase [Methylacidiphilales bacterium]|nr:HAMP domain-containing histidine kinase [Candidatus Methylacidiphilales bacterium]